MDWYEVRYLCVTGGSGLTRMKLGDIPKWLNDNPGYMIIKIEHVG